MSLYLARHETFIPRYGWLKKAYDYSDAFQNKEDSHIVLGVGKNMARSMEYWAKAFRIYAEGETGQATLIHETTAFADSLFHDETGYDPFMEYDGTLYLLHYNLVKSGSLATAWEFTFNYFNQHEFTELDLRDALSQNIKAAYPEKSVAPSSIHKDINAALRMYANHGHLNVTEQDSLDSPFTRLSLITYNPVKKRYAFNTAPKYNLSELIIVFILLDYMAFQEVQTNTFAIKDLTFPPHSPGKILKLTEYQIEHAIEKVAQKIDGIHIHNEAGIAILSLTKNSQTIKDKLLKHYYKK